MPQPTYRLTITGPGDEVLDTIALDGYDLATSSHRGDLGYIIEQGMGSRHVRACAALPDPADQDSAP